MSRGSCLLAAGLIACAGCADEREYPTAAVQAMSFPSASYGAVGPTVLTRNVYLGASLDPLFAAAPNEIPFVAAEVWAQVIATNFPARAGGLADEIAATNPHLIGLQEAVLYQIQSPGDAAFGGNTPATDIAFDFVQILLDSLAARGLSYSAVAQATATVVELPVFTGTGFDDVRFTDREVILARSDVPVSNPQGAAFATSFEIGIGGGTLTQRRAWASIDAMVHGHTFRFISAHLEVQPVAPVQVAQGAELIAIAQASPLPVIMVGDFNSAADGSQTPTYANIVAAGFQDVWHSATPGYTCCHDPDLLNERSTLDQRLDIVFLRGFRTAPQGSIGARVGIVGDKQKDRLPSGLWPSDHAGVVATLRLPPPAVAQN